jgi:serine protease Do
VLNAEGQLLGINTNRLGEGFYLAIPADEALRGRAEALARGETAAPPRLGIAITPGHVAKRMRRAVGLPETEGLLIHEVTEDSPAARAGLARGDLIVAAAGRPLRTPDDLFDALQAGPGTLELNIVRGTDERTIQVAFADDGQPGQEA